VAAAVRSAPVRPGVEVAELALLLDGGRSARRWARHAAGGERRMPGLRAAPLGLVVVPRRP
jgi:hypothetical protein